MAQLTPQDVHYDALLTNVAIGYGDPQFIADSIFPVIPVDKQTNVYPVFDQSDWFRDTATLRVSGTKSERGGYTLSNDTYRADRYSWGYELDDETRANADSVYNLEEGGVNFCMRKIMLRKEVAWASEFFTTGVWANDDVAGTDFTAWDDVASSTPLIDLMNYQDQVEGKVGIEGNTLVIGKAVWNKLKWHPDLIDVIKYTERGIITEDLFRAATGFGRVLIGRGLYTTDPKGTAEASVTYQRIFGKHALVMYVNPNPALTAPSAGYTFTWNRVPNSLAYVVRYRDDEREVDIIEANTYFDFKKTSARSGVFLQNVVA